MPVPELTVDEIISTANHSSTSVILVEGKGDLEVLRQLEDTIKLTKYVIRCGGRENLFQILSRRQEITKIDIAFLADQDQMCIFGGHLLHPKLVYTWGYSIENDILSGSRIDKLLLEAETRKFSLITDLAVKWFSYQIETAISIGKEPILDIFLENIIDPAVPCYRSHIQNLEAMISHSTSLQKKVRKSYKKLLRGKNLLQIYALILNRTGRKARFHPNSLVAVCLTQNRNFKVNLLVKNLHQALAINDLSSTSAA